MTNAKNRKKISLVALFLAVLMIFTFSGCEIIMGFLNGTLEYKLNVTYSGEQMEYGEELDRTQFQVLLVVWDSATQEQEILPVYDYVISGYDKNVAGEQTVTVTYVIGELVLKEDVKVTVKERPVATGITATYTGKDLEIGQKVNKNDFEVILHFDNGSSEEIADYTVSEVDTTTHGEKLVVISCQHDGQTFEISVKVTVLPLKANFVGISAVYTGGDLEVGESLDKSQFEVFANFDDGSAQQVTDFSVKDIDTSTSGDKRVKITYTAGDGQVYATNVTVKVLPLPTELVGITATYVGGDLQVGASLDKSNVTLLAQYSDGSSRQIVDFTVEVDTSTHGEKLATVSCIIEGESHTATFKVTVLAPPVTFVGISAKYNGEDLKVGDTLDTSKIEVIAHYSDGSTKNVTDYILGDVDTSTYGEKTVSVSYAEEGVTKQTTFKVTVLSLPARVKSISAIHKGGSVEVGQQVDKSQFDVTANYSDGTVKVVSEFNVVADTSTVGQVRVEVSCTVDGVQFSIVVFVTVTAPAPTFTGIEAYYVGSPILVGATVVKTDFVVYEVYSDGQKVQATSFTLGALDNSTSGTKQLQISYEKDGQVYVDEVDITVVEAEVTLQSISVELVNEEFCLWDSLTTANLVVVATLSNGTTTNVNNFDISKTTFDTEGEHTISVSYTYKDVTLTKEVTIDVLPAPTITAVANKTTYKYGETPKSTDFAVTLHYPNGNTDTVSGVIAETALETHGENTLVISYQYQGVMLTAQVTIKVQPVITGITATVSSSKNGVYNYGETPLESHFDVVATYSNGATENVGGFQIIPASLTTHGEQELTLTYAFDGQSYTATVIVTVNAIMVGIEADFVNVDFQVGQMLSPTDFAVVAKYSDQSYQTITDFDISQTTFDTEGEKQVELTYTFAGQTFTASVDVTVYPQPIVLTGITAEFTNLDFKVDDILSVMDFAVVASYSNGDKENVSTFQISQTTFTTVGTYTVTITYTENSVKKSCEVTVVVKEKPIVLQSITATLNKGEVFVGDTLVANDFIVVATMSNGEQSAVSEFVLSNATCNVAGNHTVIISYTHGDVTKTTTVNVVVKQKAEEVANYGKYGILSSDGESVKIIKTAEMDSQTDLQIHFLELGNQYAGDAVYIKAGDKDILIDAGSRKGSANTIGDYIDQYCDDGVLEYVIATHAHQDHIAGFVGSKDAPGIFDRYDVEVVIDYPKTGSTSQISKDYAKARDAEGAEHYTALECYEADNSTTRFTQSEDATGARRYIKLADNLEMEILYNYYYDHTTSDENDYSVCILINQFGADYDYSNPANPQNVNNLNSFLFTGDLEKDGEEKLVQYNDLPEVVLFKGGHHGSPTSTTNELLAEINPKTICICTCVGSDEYTDNLANQFPGLAMMQRVSQYTDMVFATSLFNSSKSMGSLPYSFNGNITVTCNNLGVVLTASNNLTLLKDSDWFKKRYTEWSSSMALRSDAV